MKALNQRILLVDDDEFLLLLVQKMLTSLGFGKVTIVKTGFAAWDAIRRSTEAEPFDLVISDWNMPQFSGIKLLVKVRALPETKELPFILLTAYNERAQVAEAIHFQVTSYIVKPVTQQLLREKLEQVFKIKIDLPAA